MFAFDALAPLKEWTVDGKIKLVLGIDIGGSGFRIRLVNVNKHDQYIDVPHVKASSTAETVGALNSLIETIQSVAGDFESCGAAFAIAGPINNGVCTLTNWPGEPEVRTIRISDLPEKICPHDKTIFLNDLEAGAYGVVAAEEEKIINDLFEQLWSRSAPKGPIVSTTRSAVLAMGSGFGGALILKAGLEGPLVLPTEIGHAQIPVVGQKDPKSEEEYAVVQHVSKHYYQGKGTPEYEDIASGRGLCLVYQYFYEKNEKKKLPLENINGGDIAQAAKSGDKTARQALTWHYLMFMRAAKEIAVSLCCDSIILALDNQVKNSWFVHAISDQLHDEFYNYIRPDWMNGIRVYAQTKVCNFNLLGTTYMALRLSQK